MSALPAFAPPDDALFQRAQSLLDDEWLAHDADLAPVLPMVLARGVGQDWHKAGTFRHHLVGVARSLALWGQPRDVRLLGLLHSVYGNAFVDLVKFDANSERSKLAAVVGEKAEQLICSTLAKTAHAETAVLLGVDPGRKLRLHAVWPDQRRAAWLREHGNRRNHHRRRVRGPARAPTIRSSPHRQGSPAPPHCRG